jgi:hypothetical protein
MRENSDRLPAKSQSVRTADSLGRDIRMFRKALDAILDVSECVETGLERAGGNILRYVHRNGVAQAIEIVDELTAGICQKETVGAAILRIMPSLQKAMLDQTIEQAHQRDRLQLKYVGQIDL